MLSLSVIFLPLFIDKDEKMIRLSMYVQFLALP